jgi:hypothetical protein
MGTAMYLIGEQKEDSYLDICCKNREMLARMTLIPRPAKAAVAMWYKRTPKFLIEHMGIIVSLEPLLVTHRLDWQESFVENEPFLKLDPRYRAGPDGRDVKLAFYIPKSCESLDFNGISLMAEIPEKSHFLTRILRKIIP